MGRRLNREEFLASNPLRFLVSGQRHTFTWRVYEEYQAYDLGDNYYVKAVENSGTKKHYEPFIDVPHLFLEFARLEERKDDGRAMSEWIHKYGLLGLHQYESQRFREARFTLFPREFSDIGGTGETIHNFRVETFHASWALSLFEAALDEDVEKLEEAVFAGQSSSQDPIREVYKLTAQRIEGTHTDVLVDTATRLVSGLVLEVLNAFTHPFPAFGLSRRGPTPDRLQNAKSLTASLWPRNLLGAMYLQFYWLITSGGDLSRCRHCRRIISYTSPPSESGKERKPRRDKKFCDDRCRQNYHYQNRVKPQKPERSW